MRHLIIGSGNMGKRHADILKRMGDDVTLLDLGWESSKEDVKAFDSILVTTPAETHTDILLKLCRAAPLVPLFLEKPFTTEPVRFFKPSISMVACNWRFCDCLSKVPKKVYSRYPSKAGENFYLDAVHFLDLFWEAYGEPEFSGISVNGPIVNLTLSKGFDFMDISLENSPLTQSFTDDRPIHEDRGGDRGMCGMFTHQLAHWRYCVKFNRESINPFNKADERTDYLRRLYHKRGGSSA